VYMDCRERERDWWRPRETGVVPLSVSSSQHLKGSKIPSENDVQVYNRERNSRKAGQYLIAAHSKRSIECGVPFPRGFA
jgi:hypothetical protein